MIFLKEIHISDKLSNSVLESVREADKSSNPIL